MGNNIAELEAALDEVYETRDREKIDRFFVEKMLDYAPKCCSVGDEYIYLMNEAGSYYRGISEYERSASSFQSLLQELDRFDRGQTPDYATVLNNLAGTYRMAGDYEKAESYFRQALDLYESLEMKGSYPYISALNNLSLCYQASGQYEKALDYQTQAIEALAQQEMPDFLSLATSYSNLANTYQALGRIDEAAAAVKHSIDLFVASGNTDSSSYIGALHTQAYLYYVAGEYEKALEGYQNVLRLVEDMFGKNADYAVTSRNAAIACLALNRRKEAVEYMETAAEVDKHIFGEESERYKSGIKLLEKMKKDGNDNE